jgi:hypothetical protein
MDANYIAQKTEQVMAAVLADTSLESRLSDAAIHLSAIHDHDLAALNEWAQKDYKKFFDCLNSQPARLSEASQALGEFLLEVASDYEVARYFKEDRQLVNN